jgi:cobalt-zinc-cadmium efflux system protein
MGHNHDHGLSTLRHERPLRWALALTGGFLLVELAGAWWSNSLALLSDAAHMATDTTALAIALAAVRLARRPPDAHRTYGYGRLEALGALFNGGLLLAVAGWIVFEAIGRFRAPPPVATTTMLLVAASGLVVNLAAMRLLKAGSGESLNMRGAYLEVWADMLGSVAVLLGAGLIQFTGWRWIDPAIAVLIGLWVLPRTLKLAREAVHLLLEGVPRGLALADVRRAMLAVPGVGSVHDLHLWSLSSTQPLLSAHVAMAAGQDGDALCRDLAAMLHDRFEIAHTTLQMESAPCAGPGCETPLDEHATHDHDNHDDHGAHPHERH